MGFKEFFNSVLCIELRRNGKSQVIPEIELKESLFRAVRAGWEYPAVQSEPRSKPD